MDRNIIVQKFGGTSVATEEVRKKVIEKIIDAKKRGKLPVVVVSAMGRTGDPYATDTLLSLLSKAGRDSNERNDSNESKDSKDNKDSKDGKDIDFQSLKEKDLIMSCGEIISSTVLSATLKSKGYDAEVLTGGQAGIITNKAFGDADILTVKPRRIIEVLNKGKIPVIAGFQGITEEGEITTLGRGGSDTSAVIIGEAIKASGIEIYKDVDGIMTADPKLVPNAKVIPKITYSEMFQMADSGAKVIHSRAVEVAMRANIPLIIKNTFNDSKGSIISSSDEEECTSKRQNPNKVVTSISYIPSRVQVIIDGSNNEVSKILYKISMNKISIDIINVFTDRIAFTIESQYLKKFQECLKDESCNYKITENCSKVSCIGEKMHGVPGVMAKILECLVNNNVNVLQTSDSHTTIACLIKNGDVPKAVIALHDGFGLSK